MKSYALDTNCFIDAYNPASASHQAVRQILDAWSSGKIALSVSQHTLSELVKDDEATTLAKSLPVLPHYPIGQWDQQVTTWDKLAGTWGDAKRNEALQQQLKSLANASVDIRDRGGFIDALANKLDGFVTSDKGVGWGWPGEPDQRHV